MLSSDYLRINLWNLRRMDNTYNLIDIKPIRYEELVYVITSCSYKPGASNIFGYSTSKGEIHFNDLRTNVKSEKVLTIKSKRSGSIFDDLLKFISEFKFCNDNVLCSRNLNSMTLYDMRKADKEMDSSCVFEPESKIIDEIFDSQAAYERFPVSAFGDMVVTGCFGSGIKAYNWVKGESQDIFLEGEDVDYSKRVKNVSICENGIYAGYEDSLYFYKMTF
jgi:serine/threonine-protein phosphatase 2A regulatory subunit B